MCGGPAVPDVRDALRKVAPRFLRVLLLTILLLFAAWFLSAPPALLVAASIMAPFIIVNHAVRPLVEREFREDETGSVRLSVIGALLFGSSIGLIVFTTPATPLVWVLDGAVVLGALMMYVGNRAHRNLPPPGPSDESGGRS